MDVEFKLGETEFLKLSHQQQLFIKERGRPMPDLDVNIAAKSRGRPYKRQFSANVYLKNNWICGSAEKNALFCFPCVLFGTPMKEEKVWREVGVKDLVHLSDRIKKHENTKIHIQSRMQFALFDNFNSQLDSASWVNIQRYNEEVTRNRYILTKMLDCVKFRGAFELFSRGLNESETTENPGLFRGLINFSAELDCTLKARLEKASIFEGSPKITQNEIIDCMLEVYYEEIFREINEASFLAVMVDEVIVSGEFQLVIVFRYVTQEGTPVERFYTFVRPHKHDTLTISNTILIALDRMLRKTANRLISQSFDGSVLMSGLHGGVQKPIKQKYHNAHFVHCYAHQLNSIMSTASSINSEVRLFFGELHEICKFFNCSPQNFKALKLIVGSVVLPQSAPTRWNFNNRTVNVVYANRDAIMECMAQLEKQSNATTCKEAANIRRILEDANFTFWLTFFHFIMPHVEVLNDQLQKKYIDPIEAKRIIHVFEQSINTVRNKIDAIIDEASKFIPPHKDHRRNRANDHYRACLEVCDVIIINAKERFAFMDHLVAASLLDCEKFNTYSKTFPDQILDQTCAAYKFFEKEHLKLELSVLYSNTESSRLYGAVPFLKFIISNNLDETMCETKKLLQILVTTPMITAEVERKFSTLQRIKTLLQNLRCEFRLASLTTLSIENKFIASIPNFNEKVIDKLALKKQAREHEFPCSFKKLNKDSASATGRSKARLDLPIPGPLGQGAEPSDTYLELPSTSNEPVNKRRRTNIDSYEDDSTSDSSKLIEMARDDRGASRYLQCQSDENMSDSDSVIDIIKHEIDIPEYVPDNGSLQEAETIMIKDDDDDDSSQSTHNIEEVNIKEEPISEQNNFDDRHPVDVFCKSVALSLKSLRMDLCNEGKIRIMQLISELEQRNSLPNEGPSTSKSLNNRAEPTSTVTNYLVPKKELD